jgi:UDP-3-O-[3-hydroxymyristoyl] N-acetylglucosamine deacetylase
MRGFPRADAARARSKVKPQTTIRRQVEVAGIGLHSGARVRLRLRPAAAGDGVRFVRTDLGGAIIPATPQHLATCSYATQLRRGEASVLTVEHLLSALYGMEVDNAVAELDGPEVPILDGSAVPFLDLLAGAGVRALGQPRRYLQVTRPVALVDQGKEIVALPAADFRVSYRIDFPHPAIGRQERTVILSPIVYAREVAPARTFTFVREVDALREAGLAQGGSLTNAVVLDDERLLNATLRFDDEFVRHKILDLVGDLALLGRPLLGHVMALKAGHDLHGRLIRELLARSDSWRLAEAPEPSPSGVGAAAPASGTRTAS